MKEKNQKNFQKGKYKAVRELLAFYERIAIITVCFANLIVEKNQKNFLRGKYIIVWELLALYGRTAIITVCFASLIGERRVICKIQHTHKKIFNTRLFHKVTL